MIAEEILNRLTPKNLRELQFSVSMEVPFELLEREPLFCISKETPSIESIALQLAGHAPILKLLFSEKKFKEWTEDHSLEVYTRPAYFQGYILKTRNNEYWRNKVVEGQKKALEKAIEKAILFYDMKNRAYIPTRPEQIRRFAYAENPFIECFYIGSDLILKWDHKESIEIN